MIKLAPPVQARKNIDEKIIPMINIIFLLLMFFLIAGNISELVGEDVIPPRSTSSTVSTSPNTDIILSSEGVITLRGRQFNLSQLLNQAPGSEPLPARIILRADASARSGSLLPLMDWLRGQGVEKISLVTINDDSGK